MSDSRKEHYRHLMSAQPAPSVSQATLARIVGLLVFLGGIGLLIFVFAAANTLLNAPPPTVAAPTTAGTNANAPSAAIELGRGFSLLLQKILLLLLMCVAGSLIASKGIQLFFAAGAVPAHRDTEPPSAARTETAPPPAPRQAASLPPAPPPPAKTKTGDS